jgi:hypothetical protein
MMLEIYLYVIAFDPGTQAQAIRSASPPNMQ